MKKIFREFYPFDDEYFTKLWDEAIIVPDANILLNLYFYSEKTSKELINILKKFKKRLWIPYQVALEYQLGRLNKIKAQKNVYKNLIDFIKGKINSIKKESQKKYSKHPVLEINKIEEILDKCFSGIELYLNKSKNKHPDWETEDKIRNTLDILFENKVGEPYTSEKLRECYEEGYLRYKKNIPPGYEDEKNKKDEKRKFGDLIIWLEIIEKAKKEKKPIIFITDEEKEDWWQKDSKNQIPRYELIGEMRLKAGVSFYMYNSNDFMRFAYKYLELPSIEPVIKEMKALRNYFAHYDFVNLQNALSKKFSEIIYNMETIEALKRFNENISKSFQPLQDIDRNIFLNYLKTFSLGEEEDKDDNESNDKDDDEKPEK